MARWIATLHTGQLLTLTTAFISLAGVVVGVSVIIMILALCTVAGNQKQDLDGPIDNKESSDSDDASSRSSNKSPKSWMSFSSKNLLSFKKGKSSVGIPEEEKLAAYDKDFTDNGNSPVWQRTILMGERCEPPAFSGLIFYDERGNQVQEFPIKSPRAPLIPPPFRVPA